MKLGIAVAFTLMMSSASDPPRSQASRSFNGVDLVDKAGNIIRKPSDYRATIKYSESLG